MEEYSRGDEENERRGKKHVRIDHISELPESLLIHILSFLNVKEAAITSVLSKRWVSLWVELPSLQFLGNRDIDKVPKLVCWINRALAIRTKGNILEKFKVASLYPEMFACDVDAWVQFAKEHKVKELSLKFFPPPAHLRDDFDVVFYRPPQALYSCASLRGLVVSLCDMEWRARIEWHSLTYLHIWISRVEQHLLDQILSTCPVLHELELGLCRGFNSLEANSPTSRLHSVLIGECKYDKDSPPLKISAPYLHTLHIYAHAVKRRKLELVNVSSLVKAVVDYWERPYVYDDIDMMIGAREFLESVTQVKELQVGAQLIKLPQFKLNFLRVTSEYKYMIYGIIGLLESSPQVQTLYIESCAANGGDILLEEAAKDDLAGDLLNLKQTFIVNRVTDSNEESTMLTLTRIVLKRGTILEHMVIKSIKDSSEMVKMGETACTYPKTSTKAALYFNCNELFYQIRS